MVGIIADCEASEPLAGEVPEELDLLVGERPHLLGGKWAQRKALSIRRRVSASCVTLDGPFSPKPPITRLLRSSRK